MANKFKVWVDSPGSVIMDATTFATDTQRTSGFQAGQAASALRVNSALRQANLVVAALMGLVDNDNLDLKSSVTDVSQGINTWLTNKITNTTVTNASNVSSKINNKNISEIFESDGTTVKNATTSVNATNVNIISDSTVGNNVIKFQIGSGTYNKTINNVQNADNATKAINANRAIVNNPQQAAMLTTYSGFSFNENHRLIVTDTSDGHENEETIISRKKLIYDDSIRPRPSVPSGSGTTDIVFEDLTENATYEFQLIAGTRVFYQKIGMGGGAAEAFTFGPNIWNIYYTPSTHTMTINQVNGTVLTFVRIWRIY